MKIHLQTLGCRLNQAESERVARGFRLAGHEIVRDAKDADLRIINTCTVTKEAGIDSRKAARRLHRGQRIVVTGCHSELHPEEFSEADLRLPNIDKEEIAAIVMEWFGMEGLALGMDVARERQESLYPLALANTRAFVKIQDGCNLRCSFCLTTVARGVSKSRHADEVVAEVRGLTESGCQEAVLTGVHAGSYGLDIECDLGWLIRRILTETDIPRLRLSSLEPWNFKSRWISLWHEFEGRLCRHLHMSLQSGCDAVLRRMNRHYNTSFYAEQMEDIRSAIPEMGMTTDMIVGFPGEGDREHAASLDFVRRMQFSGAHIFKYSRRPGTQAANLPNQIEPAIKKARYKEMKSVVAESERTFRHAAIGTVQKVLWESHGRDGRIRGLTDHYLRVVSEDNSFVKNTVTDTRLIDDDGSTLVGTSTHENRF